MFSPLGPYVYRHRAIVYADTAVALDPTFLEVFHLQNCTPEQAESLLQTNLKRSGYTKITAFVNPVRTYDHRSLRTGEVYEIEIMPAEKFGAYGTLVVSYRPATKMDLFWGRITRLGRNPVGTRSDLTNTPIHFLGEDEVESIRQEWRSRELHPNLTGGDRRTSAQTAPNPRPPRGSASSP